LKRVCLGKIVDAHGIKGLVKILPFDENPEFIETLGPVYKGETGLDTLKITMKNSAGNKYWLASVEGVTERDGALALRGTELFVDRGRLPEIENDGTYYHADLEGLKVVDTDGNEIGVVSAVKNFGASDLLEIQPAGRDSFYLPFTKENILDIREDAICVQIPDGLL
jgi:16S rRNA processing protein RimM